MPRRFALIALFIVGGLLRFYKLDAAPLGVQQDELSNIYDGYSIAETGADRFGESYPLVLRAFGERDYRPSLYAWLAAIPQRFTGFSVVAGRIPAAILGTISLALIFLFAREMAGELFAFFALLFAALSPLAIQFSRMAHEAGSLPGFFLILILFLWQRAAKRGFTTSQLVWLGLATGLSANCYQATKLTAPLLALVIVIDLLRNSAQKLRSVFSFAAASFVGALPQIIVFLQEPARFAARARVLSVPSRSPLSYAAAVVQNFFLNIGPHYLFVPRMLRGLTVARLNPIEILFFYVGLVGLAFVARQSRDRWHVYIAFFIALLPAAVTTDNPATMRASAMAVLTPLFSSAGVIILASLISNRRLRTRVFYPATVAGVVLTFALIAYRYTRSEYFRELSFQKIGVDMARKAGTYQSQYDAIFVQRYVSVPYIYVAAFAPMSPREFQRAPKNLYDVGMDVFTRLGKYYFVWESTMPRTVEAFRGRPGRYLFISPDRLDALAVIDSVSFQNQKLYFETY
ncbi:MAG: ArnT family glycosyltransferase [Gemmatimonadaceae bacterium]